MSTQIITSDLIKLVVVVANVFVLQVVTFFNFFDLFHLTRNDIIAVTAALVGIQIQIFIFILVEKRNMQEIMSEKQESVE